AEEAAAFLSRRGMDGITAFATSGSSGSPPKAILFTRRALDICARGALEHLHAESGDWCCPLPLWHVGGAMIYLRAALAGTAVHTLRGKWCPQAYADLMKSWGPAGPPWFPRRWWTWSICASAPSTAGCIIVGGGAGHGDGQESPRPRLARGAELRHDESGPSLPRLSPAIRTTRTAFPCRPTGRQSDEDGLLRFQGEGKLCGRS
ncbi:MAG: hypothetical protein ACLT8E_12550, partial [Akkermansia sp.]